jgi:predicted AlkP superfamily phosphohydrolase/phosphomutase/tetratricopeptide (TPR) repeat protein
MKESHNKRKVLLVGWDAADWKVINPLLDAGKMPALAKLVNNGVMGNIATLDPPLSPMLWTSIATGMRADKHGILGFAEPDTKTMGIRPVNVTSRKVKAIWNILNQNGYRSNVISWWPSHPAEPINGVYVSNFFSKIGKPPEEGKTLPKASIYPPEKIAELIDLKIYPDELTYAHLMPFVPEMEKVNQSEDRRLAAIAKTLCEASTVHAVATQVMEHTEWDFMAVYYDAIDHFCHGFMKYHPPRQAHVEQEEFELYRHVIEGAYIFHDMMLDRLLNLAGEDTTVILLSDHGFHSDHLRLPWLPNLPAAPAMEHNPLGMICISGPGIKKDDRIYGATLLDVTPTILSLFNLPVGRDMDGKPLLNIYGEPREVAFIDSWETVEGESGMHPEEAIEDTFASAEAMEQLIELGYIEDPGDDSRKAMEKTAIEAQYNLSRVLASRRDFKGAGGLLKALLEKEPGDMRFRLDLLRYSIDIRDLSSARQLLDQIRQDDTKGEFPVLNLYNGILCFHEGKTDEAMEFLRTAERSNPHLPVLHCEIGKIYIHAGQYEEGYRAFSKALSIDENYSIAHHGRAICLLRLRQYEEAVDSALNAISITYYYPPAHYHLGEALYHLQHYHESAQAFEVCVTMSPGNLRARSWLVKLYQNHLGDPGKAAYHDQFLIKTREKEVIIVSGLPRSGTSMMMQILEAGGIEVFTDEIRQPDQNNPKGYFEYEKTKSLAKDNTWVQEAEGQALKVIAHLLPYLPNNLKYKVIFMQRDMKEVIRSQQKMINKNIDTFPVAIAQAFEKEVEKVMAWARKEPDVDLLVLNYSEIIANPETEVKKISSFLNVYLDENEMISVIDPTLYRNKSLLT